MKNKLALFAVSILASAPAFAQAADPAAVESDLRTQIATWSAVAIGIVAAVVSVKVILHFIKAAK